jgi:hypothetical protein
MSKPIAAVSAGKGVSIESVPDILERELSGVVKDRLVRVELEPDLVSIPLNFEERTGHLPQLLRDLIARLRMGAGTKAPISKAASHHGDLRRKQGYTVAKAVEESLFHATYERKAFGLQHANSQRCNHRG